MDVTSMSNDRDGSNGLVLHTNVPEVLAAYSVWVVRSRFGDM